MEISSIKVDQKHAGMRLDLFLTRYLTDLSKLGELSRSRIQKIVAGGGVLLNGRRVKPGARLQYRDLIEVRLLPIRDQGLQPEPISLDVLYEDRDCIVVNKPPGMVVHPAASHPRGTLVNALLYRCPDLSGIGGEKRPGIVHRLDKYTSGVMVIAKNDGAFRDLALQFKERKVRKEYLALVWGRPESLRGIINRPIGRHRSDRKRMSSIRRLARSRAAVTEWKLEESFRVAPGESRYARVSLMRLQPRTGRTHQIRVHLADEGYPVIGDRVYGPKRPGLDQDGPTISALVSFPRQALHADRLGFVHPRRGISLEFCAPLSPDMNALLNVLRKRECEWKGKL